MPWKAVGLIALLLAQAAGAQIYRWRDAAGTVHYGDRPPPNRPAEAIAAPLTRANVIPAVKPPPPPPPEPAAPASAAGPDPRAERCRALSVELDRVQAAQRAGYTPAEGERLRDRERALRRARVRRCW